MEEQVLSPAVRRADAKMTYPGGQDKLESTLSSTGKPAALRGGCYSARQSRDKSVCLDDSALGVFFTVT